MDNINVTWDAVNKGSAVVLSNGNLTAKVPNFNNTVRATIGRSTGKWYWEITISVYNWLLIGIVNKDANLNSSNSSTQNVRFYWENGKKLPENVSYGKNFVVGDVISVLLNLDSGTLEFWKNGVSQGVSHTNIKSMEEVYPAVSAPQSATTESTVIANFGDTSFVHPIPQGFSSFDGSQRHWDSKLLIQSYSGKHLSFENNIDAATVIPRMTSNSTPSGRAFAKDIYSAPYDAWKAFNQIDDNDGYCSKNGSAGVGFLAYEFAQYIPVFKYAVRSMNSSAVLNTMPKDWTFEGSFDGDKWYVLDTQKNQTWTATNTDKDYYISNPKSYKMYRLNWTANNGYTGYTGINELKMYHGSNTETHIPSINEKYFTEYGMNKITQQTLKSDYDRARLISNRESKLNEGKTFEHEIDLKKFKVNRVNTIVSKMSVSESGENYKNIAPKLIPSAAGTFSGEAESNLYKAIEGDGMLTSGKQVGFYSPTPNSPVIFMLKPNGSAIKLNKIRVAFGVSDWSGNTTASDFEVQVSKSSTASIDESPASSNWESIYAISNNWYKDFIEIKTTTTIYTPMIRIIVYKSAHSTYLTISEVEVYGEEVSDRFLIESNNYVCTVSDTELIILQNKQYDVDIFSKYGQWKGVPVDLNGKITNRIYVSREPRSLGEGKVFKQKVDAANVPIKKVSIE
ncbi:SPRY domain-containing protein [Paenibacillus apiarius]|uniref:SPRY domain-containing protein n=1 Tax=Paenibacillus apiarius TaxID=46240 RepID=UPI001982541A|nr:hypothetical protein [Paenibacillus apiarius]